MTKRHPTDDEWRDLMFAWKICKHVRSNAIVLAKNEATAGIGAGQMSRVDSVRLAVDKSRLESLAGAVLRLRRVLPLLRRARDRDRRGRHGDHPAGRVAPRPRGRRGGRRGGHRDGLHEPPALPPLAACGRRGAAGSSASARAAPWEERFGYSPRRARGRPRARRGDDGDRRGRRRARDRRRGRADGVRARPRSRRRWRWRARAWTRSCRRGCSSPTSSRAEEIGRAHGERFADAPAGLDDGRRSPR